MQTRAGKVRADCKPSTPVLVKVERINKKKMKEEKEVVARTSIGRGKEGSTGKEKVK